MAELTGLRKRKRGRRSPAPESHNGGNHNMTQRQVYTIDELRQAARARHGTAYMVERQKMGAHGYVSILRPVDDDLCRTSNTYLVVDTAAGHHIGEWGDNFGEYDETVNAEFAAILETTLSPARTVDLGIELPTCRRDFARGRGNMNTRAAQLERRYDALIPLLERLHRRGDHRALDFEERAGEAYANGDLDAMTAVEGDLADVIRESDAPDDRAPAPETPAEQALALFDVDDYVAGPEKTYSE